MRRLRTTSTRRLLTVLAFTAALATTAAVARAALTGSGPVPAPKALANAIQDAIGAPQPDGVTARIAFTNNLLPSGSLPGASSALTSGGKGRLWLTKDGRLRLELQSSAGDAQLTVDKDQVALFDAASNTVYKATLPAEAADAKPARPHENPTLAKIQDALDHVAKMWTTSGADPTNVAGQPAYEVRIAPKDDGGLLGAAKVAWDSITGVPLRAAVYAQGQDSPVLELEATDISYGAVADSDVAAPAPANAKVVELNPKDPAAGANASHDPSANASHDPAAKASHDADAKAQMSSHEVAKQLDFALAAPDKLAGLPRQGVHLVNLDKANGALVTYGKGLGAIAVFEHKADAKAAAAKPTHGGRDNPLPQINIDGATGTEIATALGTIVTFERDGVAYVVAGSVPPLAAENAARGLR
jgi:outer membrane lipoprotein-sorting protein